MTIIEDANKYLHEEPTAFMTKERKIDRAFVLIEKLVKEVEQKNDENVSLKIENAGYEGKEEPLNNLLEAYEKEIEQLKNYVAHEAGCKKKHRDWLRCTCGLDEALLEDK